MANFIYVMASESQILYAVLITVPQDLFDLVLITVGQFMVSHLSWIHETASPLSYLSEDEKNTIMTHLELWSCVNKQLIEEDPLVRLKAFRHSTQTVYSKTRGGVGGSAQARADLRSSIHALK